MGLSLIPVNGVQINFQAEPSAQYYLGPAPNGALYCVIVKGGGSGPTTIHVTKSTDSGATWSAALDSAHETFPGGPPTATPALLGTKIYILLFNAAFTSGAECDIFDTATDLWAGFINGPPDMTTAINASSVWYSPAYWALAATASGLVALFFTGDENVGGSFFSRCGYSIWNGVSWTAAVNTSNPGDNAHWRAGQILVEPTTGRIQFLMIRDVEVGGGFGRGTSAQYSRSLNGGVLGTLTAITAGLNYTYVWNSASFAPIAYQQIACVYTEGGVDKLAVPMWLGDPSTNPDNVVALADAADDPIWSLETVDTTLVAYGVFNYGMALANVFCGGVLSLVWVTPLDRAEYNADGFPVGNDISGNVVISNRTAPNTWSAPTSLASFSPQGPTGVYPRCLGGSPAMLVTVIDIVKLNTGDPTGQLNYFLTVSTGPSCTLTSDRSTVGTGQAVTLTWTTSGSPTSASIDQGVGAVNPAGGSVVVHPASTTTYTLTVTNNSGSSFCTVTITVVPLAACTLTASATSIGAGECTTLSWTTAGSPTSAVMDNGIGPVSTTGGNLQVCPAATTTYTLSVSNAGSGSTCTVTITVAGACNEQAATAGLPVPIDQGRVVNFVGPNILSGFESFKDSGFRTRWGPFLMNNGALYLLAQIQDALQFNAPPAEHPAQYTLYWGDLLNLPTEGISTSSWVIPIALSSAGGDQILCGDWLVTGSAVGNPFAGPLTASAVPASPVGNLAFSISNNGLNIEISIAAANMSPGNLFTLGSANTASVTYTFVAALNNAVANQILIGADSQATITALFDAINTGGNGTTVSTPTVPNPALATVAITNPACIVTMSPILSGGVLGNSYTLTNNIVTTQGRHLSRNLVILWPNSSLDTLVAYKSTDGGSTWVAQDFANSPTYIVQTACQAHSATVIYAPLIPHNTVNGYVLAVQAFDTTTDTWGALGPTLPGFLDPGINDSDPLHIRSVFLSSGALRVFYTRVDNILYFADFASGAWQNVDTPVHSGGVNLPYVMDAYLGSSDFAHVIYGLFPHIFTANWIGVASNGAISGPTVLPTDVVSVDGPGNMGIGTLWNGVPAAFYEGTLIQNFQTAPKAAVGDTTPPSNFAISTVSSNELHDAGAEFDAYGFNYSRMVLVTDPNGTLHAFWWGGATKFNTFLGLSSFNFLYHNWNCGFGWQPVDDVVYDSRVLGFDPGHNLNAEVIGVAGQQITFGILFDQINCRTMFFLKFTWTAAPVVPPPPVALSCTLTASATSITFCQTVTLTWTTAGGATFAQIEPDVGPVNPAGGSVTVHPTMPITYVLTVTNQFGSSICFVEILVANAPCAKGPSQLPSKGWFQDP